MSVESDIAQIKNDIAAIKIESRIGDGIQITALVLIFFFGIVTIKDLKKALTE